MTITGACTASPYRSVLRCLTDHVNAVVYAVTRRLLQFLWTGWTIVVTTSLFADESPASRPEAKRAREQVFVGFYVNAIRDVDWQQRRFYADVYWWIRYRAPENEAEHEVIEAIEFVNSDPANCSQRVLERKEVLGNRGKEIYVNYRTVAFFHFDPDFHRYPFDSQTLPIIVEHETLAAENFVFVDDTESYSASRGDPMRWGLAEDVSLPEFSITASGRRVSNHRYQTHFGDPTLIQGASHRDASFTCSRMTLEIHLKRIFTPYLVKILVPLVICLLLPYLVFFIDSSSLDVAAGLTVTSLLACVAIQLTVVPGLPDVGYVVTSDMLFYLAYLLSMIAMAQTVWTHSLGKNNPDLAHHMDVAGRFLYPLIFLVGFLLICLR